MKSTNTENCDEDEIVQIYIKDLIASLARPVTELKGFQRIHLKKGETKNIKFKIPSELLTMLDKEMNRVVEPSAFRIMIGASSNDIRSRKILEVLKQKNLFNSKNLPPIS